MGRERIGEVCEFLPLLAEDEAGVIHPTNGFVFLLGKDPFLSHIQCGMFKGTTRAVFVDKREYGGALWEQVEDAFQFVLRNIHLGARLEGLYRQDIYELPPDSIRELIINAVMNCSFLQNSHIQVAIYDDRFEITSPGGLMPGVTLERMKEGYSKIRNRALARAFSYMNLIEAWGSGIPKLLKAMKDYGLPEPEFIEMEIAFRINLYRSQFGLNTNQDANQGTNQADQDADQANQVMDFLGKEEGQLVQLVVEEPEITQREMARRLCWSLGKVKYYITKLKKNRVLERVGSSQKGQWNVLAEDNDQNWLTNWPKRLTKKFRKLALASWLVWGGFVLWCQSP